MKIEDMIMISVDDHVVHALQRARINSQWNQSRHSGSRANSDDCIDAAAQALLSHSRPLCLALSLSLFTTSRLEYGGREGRGLAGEWSDGWRG